jgi:hypothetical protein
MNTVLTATLITAALYSGVSENTADRPTPTFITKVKRGDRYLFTIERATALVNYPDPTQPPIIAERIITEETGGKITCPWYWIMDPMFWWRIDLANLNRYATRVDEPLTDTFPRRLICDDGTCLNSYDAPIPTDRLLYGKYNLDSYLTLDGKVFGAKLMHDFENGDYKTVACQDFTVERLYTEVHYFDQYLTLDNFREEQITDLDVDLRRIYFTFINERGDQATCAVSDLLESMKRNIRVENRRDCVLPTGNEFAMYADSRFFKKETRPCGKMVHVPSRNSTYYECDGKESAMPIEKQFSYATRVEISLEK